MWGRDAETTGQMIRGDRVFAGGIGGSWAAFRRAHNPESRVPSPEPRIPSPQSPFAQNPKFALMSKRRGFRTSRAWPKSGDVRTPV
jgi:hypothetical protein